MCSITDVDIYSATKRVIKYLQLCSTTEVDIYSATIRAIKYFHSTTDADIYTPNWNIERFQIAISNTFSTAVMTILVRLELIGQLIR